MSRHRRLLSFSERPYLDHVPALIIGSLLWLCNVSVLITNADARIAIYVSIATLSGLVLAAATFVAALTYQSDNLLMAKVRSLYSAELARNWKAIILSCLVSAVASIALLVIDGPFPRAAMAIASYLLVLVSMRGRRSVWWLMYTLFTDRLQQLIPPTVPGPTVQEIYGRLDGEK